MILLGQLEGSPDVQARPPHHTQLRGRDQGAAGQVMTTPPFRYKAVTFLLQGGCLSVTGRLPCRRRRRCTPACPPRASRESSPRPRTAPVHARPFEPQSNVLFGRFHQLLAINAQKMAPTTGQWLQVRVWDTPTKGLLWRVDLVAEVVTDLAERLLEAPVPLEVRKPGIFNTHSFIKVPFSRRFVTTPHNCGGS